MNIYDSNFVDTVLLNFINYQNNFEIFLKCWKTFTKCTINIIKSNKDVKFCLNNVSYDPIHGIVDLNINKAFQHSLMHIFMDFMVNKNLDLNLFKPSSIQFLGSTSFLSVLTTKPFTQFHNVNTYDYIALENTLISKNNFVFGLGYQYSSAITTLLSNVDFQQISDFFNYSNYMKYNNELYLELLKNTEKMCNFLIDNKYITDVSNVGELVKIYEYVITHNHHIIKENFDSYIPDFNKWMLQSTMANENLNTYVRIIKDVGLTFNDNTNTPIINLNMIYTDVETLTKYKLKELNNFKNFGDILVSNEKFNTLSKEEINDVLKKFKPKIKKW